MFVQHGSGHKLSSLARCLTRKALHSHLCSSLLPHGDAVWSSIGGVGMQKPCYTHRYSHNWAFENRVKTPKQRHIDGSWGITINGFRPYVVGHI